MAIINAGPAERRNDLNLYLTAFFFALLRMVILSAKCHANQCETFRRATNAYLAFANEHCGGFAGLERRNSRRDAILRVNHHCIFFHD